MSRNANFKFGRKMKSAVFFILLFVFAAQAQSSRYGLPAGARIIENQPVAAQRALILWMQNPQKNPREGDDIYTCPEYTRGSFYRGKTRVSLVDSKTRKIINTVEISAPSNADGEDGFDVPYLIERHYYEVPVINARGEGKPKILALRDFNGDGQAREFAVYDAAACMGLDTALFGYSEKQDRIVQYATALKTGDGTEKRLWMDYLFAKKPARKGFWSYEIDYRGRGGSLDKYEIHYDAKTESFRGTLVSTAADDND